MSLLRQAATVGGFTLISRVLGFARDLIFAQVLGAGLISDAFVLAQRFPNLFRSLFAEGAFSSAFVPIFAGTLAKEGEASAKRFAEEALSFMVPILIGLTLIVQAAMPWVMLAFAAGFTDDAQKFELSVLFSRIMFPYLMLMALCALYAGILNSLGKFWVAAAAPILLNVVLIIGLVVIAPLTGMPGHGQAVCVTVSGVLQVLWMARAARASGMDLRLRWPKATPRVLRLLKIALPGTFAAGITQVNIMIGTVIASATDNAVTYLYYAERLYQLPLGVIGIAIGAVLLPDLSRRLSLGDDSGSRDGLNRAAEFCLLLTLPATAALLAIPLDILVALFRHGAFTLVDAKATAPVLIAFATGLPAYVLIKVLTPAFFARADTRTPVKFAAISVVVNIAGSLALYPLFDYVGIAIATSVAAWVNVGLLAQRLYVKKYFAPDTRLIDRLARMAAAAILMALALLGMAHGARPWLFGPIYAALPSLLVITSLSVGLYGAIALAVRAVHWSELKSAIRPRRRPGAAATSETSSLDGA
jgi:putative peptidoglycan lipid II flippase